ncbi:MAG: site-specific integrase [Candidatus Thiodiazotropha taylori]
MALYKRGIYWWVSFTTPNGKRVRRSSRTSDRKRAQQLHDKLKSESWKTEVLNEIPLVTWDEAAYRWIQESTHKADHHKDISKLSWLARYLCGVKLCDINREIIGKIGNVKATEASTSTANRYLSLVRSILRKAANEWDWLDQAPVIRLYPENSRRIRWLTQKQAQQLLYELPSHQAKITKFALATGLRKANILGLLWEQIDLERHVAWIHPDQAKARRAIAVPLNGWAMSVLRSQTGIHPSHVFTYLGKPIQQVNTKSWKSALMRAGISDFRWHDLRHTWASWHVQAGTPLNVLQELGGWESIEMVRRYAHLAPEHLAVHAERISETHLCHNDK